MLHVNIKTFLSLSFVLLLALTQPPNTCLLQEPLTDQCLTSVSVSALDKEVTPYLCVIAI